MDPTRAALDAPELRGMVERYVRARVPAVEVEDIVQTVLCQAWAAAPQKSYAELSRWVLGIARHKVADLYRESTARARLVHATLDVTPRYHDGGVAVAEWLHWAEGCVAGDCVAERTLHWMARESEGEKLVAIAEREAVPHEVVRQRVSRLRRRMRRWYAAELAVLLAVGGCAWWWTERDPAPVAEVTREVGLALGADASQIAALWKERGFSCVPMTDPPGTAWTNVVHEHDEMVHVLDGELEIRVGSVVHRLAAGQELRIPQGQAHTVQTLGGDPTARVHWLYGYANAPR